MTQVQYAMVDEDGRIITATAINFTSQSPDTAALDKAVLETLTDIYDRL